MQALTTTSLYTNRLLRHQPSQKREEGKGKRTFKRTQVGVVGQAGTSEYTAAQELECKPDLAPFGTVLSAPENGQNLALFLDIVKLGTSPAFGIDQMTPEHTL